MATCPTPAILLISTFFFFLVHHSPSAAAVAVKPIKALVLPVTKDPKTHQYTTVIHQRTPSIPVPVAVDLGGRYLWVDCSDPSYVSSTYRPVRCGTAQCSAAKSTACGSCNGKARPGCSNNNTCVVFPGNPFIRLSTSGDVSEDAVAVRSTDGFNPGRIRTIPRFVFTCGASNLVEGLAKGAKGVIGLGKTRIAAPTQFAAKFSFDRKFALCLASSFTNGVIFFGDGPYGFLASPESLDLSKSLMYTPLLTNPVSTAGASTAGEPSYEYFVGVKSINVDGKAISLNTTLLTIDRKSGEGGTKISTVEPYTVLESSIYESLSEAFIKASVARGLKKVVTPVEPFKHCFDEKEVGSTRVGPAVPNIDLVLQNKKVFWTIFGSNSMVSAKPGVLCLGFVDGGRNPTTSIVIGGHQLEDNLLQFDLAASRLGFSSSLLFIRTTCANFNFTTNT